MKQSMMAVALGLAMHCAWAEDAQPMATAAPAAVKAVSALGNAVQGMLVGKGENWIRVKAEGEKEAQRYEATTPELVTAIAGLTIPSTVNVIWAPQGETRQLIRVEAPKVVATEGVVEGTVTAKEERWVEVKAADGQPERYTTVFIKGKPDPDTVRAIAAVKVGDNVKVTWKYNERKRVLKIEKLGGE